MYCFQIEKYKLLWKWYGDEDLRLKKYIHQYTTAASDIQLYLGKNKVQVPIVMAKREHMTVLQKQDFFVGFRGKPAMHQSW
jgi:hypothetical protein